MSAERPPVPERLTGPILLTGASGGVGTLLRGPLARLGPLRLADRVAPAGADDADSVVTGDLADPEVAEHAVAGVSAVVHLAAYPRPDATWDVLVDANLRTTAALLDAAARHQVRRLVLASSVHVAGGYGDPAGWPVDPGWPARPCCRYGVSKATSELLVQRYADDDPAVAAVSLRLGLVAPAPRWRAELRGWTPETDLGPFVAGALRVRPGYQVHFAVTAVDRPRYRTDGLRAELGHRSEAHEHHTGPLGDAPPEYAEECRLWRHPALASWLHDQDVHT
jgi:NAD(P)-dependent dehydrogenase (short-subunit alcohol dehydrogenase family)